MSDYKFAGINVWTYSCNRAIVWFGGEDSHYGDQGKHYLQYERGSAGDFGLEIIVGGENHEVTARIGLLFATFYIGVTGLVRGNETKLQRAAKALGCYNYEVDFADQGRITGFMFSFIDIGVLSLSFWDNSDSWTSRKWTEKLRHFPYCEGIAKRFYWKH